MIAKRTATRTGNTVDSDSTQSDLWLYMALLNSVLGTRPLLPYGYSYKASCAICNFSITNDGITRSGTGCFIAVPIWQQWASKQLSFSSKTGNKSMRESVSIAVSFKFSLRLNHAVQTVHHPGSRWDECAEAGRHDQLPLTTAEHHWAWHRCNRLVTQSAVPHLPHSHVQATEQQAYWPGIQQNWYYIPGVSWAQTVSQCNFTFINPTPLES